MLLFHHRSKAPGELASHKAALEYHKKKHSLPPMQQSQRIPAQKISDISSAPLCRGNVFQDGMMSLPVMQLSEHHLSRLQKLRAQRPKDSSSPSGGKRLRKVDKRVEAKEKMEKRKKMEKMKQSGSIGEDQPRTTDIITQPISISFHKIRKASQKGFRNTFPSLPPKDYSRNRPKNHPRIKSGRSRKGSRSGNRRGSRLPY
ncbi:35bcc414-3fa7-4064-91c4-7443bd8fd83d-CDS [Sclerotinia trifoliorum]|uniref:35bcc414-3fa7-4064-91c4-7443bd8fd83d-CDS n=1 Tax=Sclerotinia trifoliorum TaxID=28548 RepID=A0A8H2ZY12_9HELO|nr:35bcc414-3fa7-4064-91c4-7443bd8fd83d-CDS [Sclerotinia trifoliorum]